MTNEELDVLFPLPPDSFPQAGVPKGTVTKHTFDRSTIFPGTVRDYWIYVPAQYDPAKAACVMIVQDGEDHLKQERRWRMPVIFDNLIHRGDIPISIGVFINPGMIPAVASEAKPRNNRSYEYDSLNDRYARFLLEEILPEVARTYNLKTDAGSRMLLGGSSGAMCSFNAAWQRPDAFQRVLSIVGSYTAMRGGHEIASRVRAHEAKPLRVFLEGGADDLEVFAGHWWVGNLDLHGAMKYSGYEVNHAWHEKAGHNDYHGSSIFPDALRWLWKDYPQPITAGRDSRQPIAAVLAPGEGWQRVAPEIADATALASGADGAVFVARANGNVERIATEDGVKGIARGMGPLTHLACDAKGAVHACQPKQNRVVRIGDDGKAKAMIEGVAAGDVCFATDGTTFVTEPAAGKLWRIASDGARSVAAENLGEPACVRLSNRETALVVNDAREPVMTLFTVKPDKTLVNRAPYFRLGLPDDSGDVGANEIAVHAHNWMCVATNAGLQLVDADGRNVGYFAAPCTGRVRCVAFGGEKQDTLWIACDGKLFRRKVRAPEHLWM